MTLDGPEPLVLPTREPAPLVFRCVVVSGFGQSKELVLPGRSALPEAPPDWPAAFHPGTLNAYVEGYPRPFQPPVYDRYRRVVASGTTDLDRGVVAPAVRIPAHAIGNNWLVPVPGEPSRGRGQLWRCRVRVVPVGVTFHAWIFRRIRGRMGYHRDGDQLELVSADNLREAYGLADHQRVDIALQEVAGQGG
jgi:hypothetical protein